ncbi:MAG: hypothetical protein M3N46_14190 [Actinomycetota bacterium]|nr:hypothetical protein [Actinomycetota bacterium]
MTDAVEVDTIRGSLPGTWRISATNFPMWVNGSRRNPEFEYALRTEKPLALDDRVHYTDERGRRRTITGVDRWAGDHFVWRGAGVLGLLRSHWHVASLTEDVLVLHFEKSSVTPAGTDVAIRAGSEFPELRRRIAGDPGGFGLTVEQFASLSWLDHIPAL